MKQETKKTPEWAGMQIALASYALGGVSAQSMVAANHISESRFDDALVVIDDLINRANAAKRYLEQVRS